MELYLNGVLIGPVSAGVNDGLSSYGYDIAAADMLVGQNTITFKQANDVAYKWGVTNVKIDTPTPVIEEPELDTPVANLALGVTDTGIYGQRHGDARDDDGLVSYTFDATGDDLVLSFDGYDLDSDGEMELYLNGVLIEEVSAGANNGLSSYSVELAAIDLMPGENTVTFKQANNVAYVWGVTNVKIDTPVPTEPPVDIPVAHLSVGVTETGTFGHRYNGMKDDDGLISFTFDATGNDMKISLDGYDIDSNGEVEVYLNGTLAGELTKGPNNGLIAHSFEFASEDLLAGTNTVTFKQANDVLYVWGVTNLTMTEVPNMVGTTGDDRIVGGETDDTLFGDTGNDVFVFFQGGGLDVIADFTLADDVIELQNFGVTQFSDLNITNDVDLNAVVTLSGTDILTLEGVEASLLTDSHFTFV